MVDAVGANDLTFAMGPAGTGKTYTAVALAVRALKNKEVKRLILTRPAVEAGESLGFLPGDMKEKLDPYMQPLYDALVSFAYNLGPGSLQGSPGFETLTAALRSGRKRKIAKALLLYNRAGGIVLPGLVRRRRCEARMILSGNYSTEII